MVQANQVMDEVRTSPASALGAVSVLLSLTDICADIIDRLGEDNKAALFATFRLALAKQMENETE